jgi:Spy/CpxP family protein refolding chaperone
MVKINSQLSHQLREFKIYKMKIIGKKIVTVTLALLFISLSTSMFAMGSKEKDKKEEGKTMGMEKKEMCSKDCKKGSCCGIKGLSDEQKQKIEKMKSSHQKEMLQLKNLECEKKSHLKTLETADNADLNAINKTIDEIGAVNVDKMKKCAAHKQEIRKILTDEQRISFDLKECKKGMKEKEGRRAQKQRPDHDHDGDK